MDQRDKFILAGLVLFFAGLADCFGVGVAAAVIGAILLIFGILGDVRTGTQAKTD
jgi:hypothetical protein